jgi:hypothetical protein
VNEAHGAESFSGRTDHVQAGVRGDGYQLAGNGISIRFLSVIVNLIDSWLALICASLTSKKSNHSHAAQVFFLMDADRVFVVKERLVFGEELRRHGVEAGYFVTAFPMCHTGFDELTVAMSANLITHAFQLSAVLSEGDFSFAHVGSPGLLFESDHYTVIEMNCQCH